MANPLEIFPVEVWRILLDCVNDPQDIQSCYRTCKLFKSHFSRTRTNWAFSFVFPSLMQYLPRSDVLQCRLVSKNWLNGVDNFLQSDNFAPTLVRQLRYHGEYLDSSFPTNLQTSQLQPINRVEEVLPEDQLLVLVERDPNEPNPVRRLAPEIQNPQNIERDEQQHDGEGGQARQIQNPDQSNFQKFMTAFENNCEKNPFPSRAIVLRVMNSNIVEISGFLNKFGEHIWSLRLNLKISHVGGPNDITLIWNVLRFCPNLKHLLIKERADPHAVLCKFAGKDFKNFLDATAAPVLQQLKWLELSIDFMSIREFLVKCYSGRSVTIFTGAGYILPCNISNDWKHLKLEFGRGTSFRCWNRCINSFKLLNLPLESIDLHYSVCFDFESIFDSLSKYGSTLRRLTLTFNRLQIMHLAQMTPQVNAIYVSFLSQMKCLEKFKMIVDCAGYARTIEFRQFVDAILNADWIKDYVKMGGIISGFRNVDFACISARLRTKADGSEPLKRIFFNVSKYMRSMVMVPCKDI